MQISRGIKIKMFDQNVQLFLPFYETGIRELFVTSNYSSIEIEFKKSNKEVFKKIREKWSYSYTSGNLNFHLVRQLAGLLAGQESKKYNLVHGAGVTYKNRGIVFIGDSGSGKSSLSKLFPLDNVLDDDILGVTNNKMEIVGKIWCSDKEG